jgi:hypothetical protein
VREYLGRYEWANWLFCRMMCLVRGMADAERMFSLERLENTAPTELR